MDAEKLEHMIFTIQSNDDSIPIQTLNEYNQEILEFQLSQEGFLWCIANFANFQSGPLILFSIETFKTWISSNWEFMTDEIVEELKQILFLHAKLSFNAFSLTQAQYKLFEQLYPENWPTFWEDLLTLNQSISLKFLQEFVSSIKESEKYDNIIIQMQSDNSEIIVVQFVISQVEQGSSEASSILTQMLAWIDPTPILDSSIILLIQEELNNSIDYIANNAPAVDIEEEEIDELFQENVSKLESAIKFLTGIVNSEMIDPSVLSDLLAQFEIIDKMMLICQNENFENVMGTASNLISACAHYFEETEDAPQYYELCILLLSHPSVDVVEQIITFIDDYTTLSEDESIAQNSFVSLSNRLSVYFTTKPDEIDLFASSLLKAINNILSKNEGMLDAYLDGFLSNPDLSAVDPLTLIAMFNILIDATQAHIQFDKRNEVAIFFAPLLEELHPPYEDNDYYAISSFMTFLTQIASQFNPRNEDLNFERDFPPAPIFQAMFVSLIDNLVVEYNIDSLFQKEKFIEITKDFIRTNVFKNFVDIISEQIYGLVGTGDFDTILIASRMFLKFNFTERTEIFQNCMELLMTAIESAENPCQIIHSMLRMIKDQVSDVKDHVLNNENSDAFQSIMPYMEKILPLAIDYGEIMAMFLDTLYSSFRRNGLNLLLSIINDDAIHSVEGLTKACEIADKYVKDNLSVTNGLDWLNDCVNKIFIIMNQLIDDVSDWTDISEETRLAALLLNKFYVLIAGCSQFLAEELNSQFLTFTGEIFPVLFQMDKKETLKLSLDYLTSLVSSQLFNNILLDNFVPPTFQIFTDDEPQERPGEWQFAAYSTLGLQHNLLKFDHDLTIEKIAEIFHQFPQSETTNQAMNEYIHLLEEENDMHSVLIGVKDIFIYIRRILNEQ